MQNFDKTLLASNVELLCLAEDEPETESLVIIELLVPVAAKVPAPRQRVEVAKLVVQQASVTSTVPPTALTHLRANNTALGAAWCTTATLAATPARQRALR